MRDRDIAVGAECWTLVDGRTVAVRVLAIDGTEERPIYSVSRFEGRCKVGRALKRTARQLHNTIGRAMARSLSNKRAANANTKGLELSSRHKAAGRMEQNLAPTLPSLGDEWIDTTTGIRMVWDGAKWEPIETVESDARQLKVYGGTDAEIDAMQRALTNTRGGDTCEAAIDRGED